MSSYVIKIAYIIIIIFGGAGGGLETPKLTLRTAPPREGGTPTPTAWPTSKKKETKTKNCLPAVILN